jgi:hypothetical protein
MDEIQKAVMAHSIDGGSYDDDDLVEGGFWGKISGRDRRKKAAAARAAKRRRAAHQLALARGRAAKAAQQQQQQRQRAAVAAAAAAAAAKAAQQQQQQRQQLQSSKAAAAAKAGTLKQTGASEVSLLGGERVAGKKLVSNQIQAINKGQKPPRWMVDDCRKRNQFKECNTLCNKYGIKPACIHRDKRTTPGKKKKPSSGMIVDVGTKFGQKKPMAGMMFGQKKKRGSPSRKRRRRGKPCSRSLKRLCKRGGNIRYPECKGIGGGGRGRGRGRGRTRARARARARRRRKGRATPTGSRRLPRPRSRRAAVRKRTKQGFTNMNFTNMNFTTNCCLIIFILLVVFLFKKEIMNFLK